ncbi:SDR family oxidoreductase [bacterium]|nr:SDR family oxidoreductase [bacterium]
MTESFKGKWALILGASSGFGAASARALAKAGLNIIGVHLDRKAAMESVETLKTDLQNFGVEVKFFNINAADEIKRQELLSEMKELACGKIHVLMHSLAFGALKPFIEKEAKDAITKSQVEMTMDVMANSLIYWAQDLERQGFFCEGARVYAMTSAGSSRVWKSYGAVSAAKAALESHCRQLALELAPRKICVNAILAGVTDTPALRKIPGNSEMVEAAQKRNPMGRLTTPEDVANALVALSSPYCSFITGNTLRIDGGENVVE